MKYLPKLEKKYDVAISYLWPHYFVAEKVSAKKKIAWIHTDFSTIETDIKEKTTKKRNLKWRYWRLNNFRFQSQSHRSRVVPTLSLHCPKAGAPALLPAIAGRK